MLLNTWELVNTWNIPEVVTDTAKGGYVPPKYISSKLRKKDESILESVYALVAKVEEEPFKPPAEITARIKRTVKRAENVVNIEDARRHRQELQNTMTQIERLETIVNKHIKETRADEDAAISALLSVI